MLTRYERHRRARQAAIDRRTLGESLEAYHRRETAKPPTLAAIYCENHKNRTRCTATEDLFTTKARRRGRKTT